METNQAQSDFKSSILQCRWPLIVFAVLVWSSSKTDVHADCSGLLTIDAGTFGGSGQVNGDLTNVGGILTPGGNADVGGFSILGNYCQLPEASMRLEIGGLRLRSEHDFLWVNGTAELAGELELTLFNDFVPSIGDEFMLFNLAQTEGQFDAVVIPELPAGSWDLSTLLDDGVARIVPETSNGLGLGLLLVWGVLRRSRFS